MLTWREFERARPDLAEAGRGLICQFGVGLAFLATVHPDGSPRMHPISPQFAGDGFYGLIAPSPKLNDLLRDGRYSLHSYPSPDNEDAFYITGQAQVIGDGQRVQAIREAYLAEPGRMWEGQPLSFAGQTIIEFLIETCLLTRTSGHGDFAPRHTVWHAGRGPTQVRP